MVVVGVILGPIAFHAIAALLVGLWRTILNIVLGPLVALGILSLILAPMLGERFARHVGDFWMGLLKLAVSMVGALARFVGRLFKI